MALARQPNGQSRTAATNYLSLAKTDRARDQARRPAWVLLD
jgi:hypothetical protein